MTQLLSISSKSYQTKAWIRKKDGSPIYSEENLKLLGFMFGNRSNVHNQVDYLIGRAASRAFVIRRLANVKVDKSRLIKIYSAIVRLVLEYSSIAYGPMIIRYDSNRLGNLQKHCLRNILGFNKNYRELLEESGLSTLEDRRKTSLKKFAEKMVKKPNFRIATQSEPLESKERKDLPGNFLPEAKDSLTDRYSQ